MESDWLDEENARLYDYYTKKFGMYHKLAHKLIELADIQPGMRVVDVACGTGIVTSLVMKQLGSTENVIGTDLSAAMIRMAQQNYPSVRFLTLPTEHIHEIIPASSADVVLCNSAFWMMERIGALHAIHQVLKPEGRFLFNVPEFISESVSLETIPLLSLMSTIAREDYGYAPLPPLQPVLPDEVVQESLAATGFRCVLHEENALERDIHEMHSLSKIPAILAWFYPQMEYAERMNLLDKAYAHYTPSAYEKMMWSYYVVQKC